MTVQKSRSNSELSTVTKANLPKLVLQVTGDWGRWQCQFFIFFIITAICSSWHSLQLSFIAPNVKYWCIAPEESPDRNATDQCTVNGQTCTAWYFDVGHNDSFYHRTIISEWNLVCEQKWLASFTQSMYMFGTLSAVFFMSHCSDRIGRKPTIIIGWIVQLAGCLSCAFSQSIIQFLLSRFLVAFGMGTTWSNGFVLLLEIVGTQYREVVGLCVQLGWALGYLSLPGVAYLVRDFRSILFCCAGMQCLQVLLYFALPESPRWLLANGRYEQAEKVLKYAAKVNKRTHLVDIEKEFAALKENSLTEDGKKASEKKYSILDLLSSWNLARMTVMIYFIWFVNSLVYYGLSLNTNDFVGDAFLNFFLLGSVEIPSYLFCIVAVKKYGHKKTLLVTLVIAGLSCLAAISILYNYNVGIVFAMAGKFCVTASFAIVYVYTGQTYPTVLRSIGVGSSSTVARIGSMLAPFIKDLSAATSLSVSMVLLGTLSIVGGVFILFLREPKGIEMPDTPEDMEKTDKP